MANVLYPLSVILMETFWVYPWLLWMGNLPIFSQPRSPLSLASVVVVLVAAAFAIRQAQKYKWSVWLTQVVIVVGGLVVILLTLSIEYAAGYGFLSGRWFAYAGNTFSHFFNNPNTMGVALVVLLYLWWRGTRLGQSTSFFRSIYHSFILGVIALIVLILIWQFSPTADDTTGFGTDVVFHILAFFFFGLLAMAVSHLYVMRGLMQREEAGLSSIWRWLPTMLIVIGGIVIVVFGIGNVFSEGFYTAVRHGMGVAWDFILKIFNYVIIVFNFIFEGIFWVVRWFVELIRGDIPELLQESGNTSLRDVFPETTTWEPGPTFILVFKWIIITLIIAVIVFILAKAVSRIRAGKAEDRIEEIHESLFSWQQFGKDLRELLGLMGKKFRKRPSAVTSGYDNEAGRMDVREIYRRLLHETARSGLPRHHHETPAEYSGRVERLVPDSREPLSDLTDTYVNVRYGEIIPPDDKVDNANRLWRTLRGMIRRLRGE